MKRNQMIFLGGICVLMAFSQCKSPESVPFDAEFTGTYTAVYEDSLECGPGGLHVIVDCSGTGTPLGSFTTHFDFCSDPEGYYPGKQMIAYMIDSNGDSLYIKCAGQVLPGRQPDHPEYVTSYWRDPFEILGGSGKFKDATGGGRTDDYNSSEDENSHHHWEGTITLAKEK